MKRLPKELKQVFEACDCCDHFYDSVYLILDNDTKLHFDSDTKEWYIYNCDCRTDAYSKDGEPVPIWDLDEDNYCVHSCEHSVTFYDSLMDVIEKGVLPIEYQELLLFHLDLFIKG